MTQVQHPAWEGTSRRWLWMPPLRPVVPPRPARPQRAALQVALLAVGCLATIVFSYVLVEALNLRFLQPWRLEALHKVRFFQLEVRHPAIVYLGTSQMLHGVMPTVVAETAAAAGRPLDNVGFNLAVPGAELEISWILARDLLINGGRPQHLVLGVFPLVMAGGQKWAPEFYHRYATLADVSRRAWAGDVPWSQVAAVSMRGVENLLQWPFFSLKKPPRVYAWSRLRLSHGGNYLPEDAVAPRSAHADVWQRIEEEINKAEHRYLRFADDTHAAWLLRQFRDLARARGMQLTIVYPPQATGETDLAARYQVWFPDFCRREGLKYVDLNQPDQFTSADFTDPYHLNARGAMKFSRLLGQHLSQRDD